VKPFLNSLLSVRYNRLTDEDWGYPKRPLGVLVNN
jgi:hypothetical protein